MLNPSLNDSRSGPLYAWSGVASDFVSIGTSGVLQAGVASATGGTTGATVLQLKTFLGKGASQQHPKVRTWRTVH